MKRSPKLTLGRTKRGGGETGEGVRWEGGGGGAPGGGGLVEG